MRPGQLTPENRGGQEVEGGSLRRFNEAGAINPGKHDAVITAFAAYLALQ